MTDTTATKSISDLLDMLGQVRAKRSEYDDIMMTLDEDESSIRNAIDVLMRENDIARTKPVNGLYAVIQERTQTTVVDPHAAMQWLEERNELGQFMKLDHAAVIKKYKDGIPGIRIVPKPTLAINTVKEADSE